MADILLQHLKRGGGQRPILVVGPNGCGKSTLVRQVIEDNGFSGIWLTAEQVRTKSMVEELMAHPYASVSVLSVLRGKPSPTVLVLDELDEDHAPTWSACITLLKESASFQFPVVAVVSPHQAAELHGTPSVLVSVSVDSHYIYGQLAALHLSPQLLEDAVRYCAEPMPSLHRLSAIRGLHRVGDNQMVEQYLVATRKVQEHTDLKQVAKRIMQGLPVNTDCWNGAEHMTTSLIIYENLPDHCVPPMANLWCKHDYYERLAYRYQHPSMLTLNARILLDRCKQWFRHTPAFGPDSQYGMRFTTHLSKHSVENGTITFLQELVVQHRRSVADLRALHINRIPLRLGVAAEKRLAKLITI